MGTKQICSILIAPYRIFFFFLNLQSLSTWALGFWQAWWLMFPFQYKKKPSAINRLLVIKPWQVKATGCHCRLWYERERADVSGAAALNVSDEYQLHIVPFICETQHVISRCFYANTLHESRSWRRLAKKKHSPYQPVSCSSRGSPSCTLWQNAPTHVFDPCRRQCVWIWKGKRNERMDFIQRCVSFQKKFSKSNLSKEQIKY